MSDIVPRFLLYGEAEAEMAPRFLHLETILARSGPHGWRIAPHRHAELVQLMLVVAGGGRLRLDQDWHDFAAPCLLLLPAAVIHGFDFTPGTEGWVLTAAEAFAAEAQPEGARLDFGAPLLLPLGAEAAALERRFAELAAELGAPALGQAAALAALLRLLLLAVARAGAAARLATSPELALFSRFRAQVEEWFRQHRPLPDYLAVLGCSEKKLAAACRAAVGRSPKQVVQQRLLAEARRSLLYTSLGVAEVGYRLGFQDPAYFARFFRRHAGQAPSRVARRP